MILEKIRELCLQKKTTIGELERTLEFGHATVRNWERSSPSADKLKKVADYFGVSIDYLLTENDISAASAIAAKKFDCLSDSQKQAVLQIIDSYSCEDKEEIN